MNSKKLIKTFSVLCFFMIFLSENIFGQSLIFDREDFFNTLFEQKFKINSYYLGKNPAFLEQETSYEELLVETSFNNNEGKFKSFFEPEEISKYQISFTGKKKVTENIIFKGSAGFQKEIRNNWNWFTNKYYKRNLPFLYGDSTVGTTRYNSILLNAQYSSNITEKFNVGFSIDYVVDEGLKKISPKPESIHRELMLNLGFGFKLNECNIIGLTLGYNDFTEKINYSEDKGAIYDQTIIFKFKGYDFPTIYNKKVDKRQSYRNVYNFSFNFEHNSDLFNLAAMFKNSVDVLNIKDNIYVSEGSSKWNNYVGTIKALYKNFTPFYLSFYYRYNNQDNWAKHPKYDVLLTEEKISSHLFSFGVEYQILKLLSVGLEAGIKMLTHEINDYYSDIESNYKNREYLTKIGLSYIWTNNIKTDFGFAYNKNNISDDVLSYQNTSNLFNVFRKNDLYFLLTPSSCYSGFIKTNFDVKDIGNFVVDLVYSSTLPYNNKYFENLSKNNINLIIQFWKKVY